METFSELWSSLRERRKTQTLKEIDAENDLKKLSTLVDTPERQSHSTAEWISVGASLSRNDWVTTGLVQFATFSFDQKKIALDSISDLSQLGNRMDRWAIIEPVLGLFIPDSSDPAINYVNTGDISLLKELTQFGWQPSGEIPTEVDREIRIQVGWRAIDEAKKVSNLRPFQEFFTSNFLGSSAFQAPREWEFRYLKAFFTLICGDYSHAKAIIESATRRPNWSQPQLALEARRVAFYAIDRRAEWLRLCSGAETDVVPGNDEDHVTFKLLDWLVRPSELRPSNVNELQQGLKRNSWLLVLIFLIPALRNSARSEIAKVIYLLDDQTFANLPLEHFSDQFASLIGEVDDPVDVLPLAIRALDVLKSEKLTQFIAETFAKQNLQTSLQIISSFDTRKLERVQNLLPMKLKAVITRGYTSRAIVDASNVLYCGLDIKSGARPHLKYLTQAMKELSEAGFNEIVVFLDRNTISRFSDQDQRTLFLMQTNRQLSVVPYADPLCLEAFLAKPSESEIISCDKFSDFYKDEIYKDGNHSEIREKLARIKLKRRPYFRNQHDSIEWLTPLNRKISND